MLNSNVNVKDYVIEREMNAYLFIIFTKVKSFHTQALYLLLTLLPY